MKVIIAIDSFKGCISSKEAKQAAAEGIKNIMPEADIHQVTVSDGGEGFMEAFHAAIGGNWLRLCRLPSNQKRASLLRLLWGGGSDSNRRHSEPQSDALTN